MGEAVIIACLIAYVAFRNWLNHDKRRMIHQERLAAIEKGLELPAIEQEVVQRSFNVQRFLLLAGWSWIFVGIGGFVALSVMLNIPDPLPINFPPRGTQYVCIIPIGIGLAHLITYWTGQRHDR